MRKTFEQAIYDALGNDADVRDVASALWYYGELDTWMLLWSSSANKSEELIKAFEAVTDAFGPGWRVVEYQIDGYHGHSPVLLFGKLRVDDFGAIRRIVEFLNGNPRVSCEWVPADRVSYYIIPKDLVEQVKDMIRQANEDEFGTETRRRDTSGANRQRANQKGD